VQLKLKNIGMIKEADIALDGLTVIAGENDTGKSTVGKALYLACIDNNKKYSSIVDAIFANNLHISNGQILLVDENQTMDLEFLNDNKSLSYPRVGSCLFDAIMIETPLALNFVKLFKDLTLIESNINIDIDYPYLMKDLIFKLSIKNKKEGIDIKKMISPILNGEFREDDKGDLFFSKDDKKIEMVNTATGIKYFGILQLLSEKNHINKDTILFFDEPEVHLHPKWQLKMAKLIVELVKNGVKIVVNSHSPYMIEALERYSEKADIVSDFYLAEDGFIAKVDDNNSKTLSKIFSKLSEPFDVFEKMDSEILQGG
jgi:predicted ATPase